MPADRHPSDEQLLDRYFDPSSPDQGISLHLFRCASCASRLQAITAGLEEDYAGERAAADRYFTQARLDAQREQVLARLAQPREARVITFPGSFEPPAPRRAPLRRPSRLAASAAALLLFAGGLTGWRMVHDQRQPRFDNADAPFSAPTLTRRAADERLLSEVEVSLVSSRAGALGALDAITPMEGR